MAQTIAEALLPDPITIDCRTMELAELMDLEWLVTNNLGSYASGTVPGANTRRYHGLLVAAAMPPVGRQVVVANLLEQLVIGRKTVDLSTFKFAGAVSPGGYVHLVRFVNDIAPTWVFQYQDITITRQLVLSEQSNVVTVRYRMTGPEPVGLRIWPFLALRDFHGLRKSTDPHELLYSHDGMHLRVEDRLRAVQPAHLHCERAEFIAQPQWWYQFQYPVDLGRGQEGLEDLYTPGHFQCALEAGPWTQLTLACERTEPVDADGIVQSRRRRLLEIVSAVGAPADETTRRLAAATDAFVVTRLTDRAASASTVAGYHWFGDWGRDTFISMTGLTLLTGRQDKALQILRTFAAAMRHGMVPNLFDDYGGEPHYNSIDASLWFILAADRCAQSAGDEGIWRREFLTPVRAILQAYHDGTQFDIRADADGLITGGNPDTQLTWMDAKFNNIAMTPRHGKAVEINALYLEALHIMARRCRDVDSSLCDHYAAEADRVAKAFAAAFWFEQGGFLYDCLTPQGPDGSLRPNQVIALAMPGCPLPLEQQRSALRIVRQNLLTPCGLRTLNPDDGRYRARYGGSWESRDRAYHQGTVWPWLLGYMVQAHLKIEGFSDAARIEANGWLAAFDQHLRRAGLGQVSEIFDGDAPHQPRGCIAQAWSVAELLRAKLMIQRGRML